MAQKFVKADGLHNVFSTSSETTLDITSIKPSAQSKVNQNSIVFLTATSGDEQYGYDEGSKYIWTHGELYPTNSYDEIIKEDEEVIAGIISKLNYTIGLDASVNLVWSEESGLTEDTIKEAIEYVSMNAGVKINDSSINASETWSSLKISDELNNIDIVQIDDSSIDSSMVWSSLKVNNEILAVKAMPYLKFTANTAGSIIRLSNYGGNTPDIKYSRDGVNWTQWDYSAITLTNVGDYVYMKGDNSQGFSSSDSKYSQFVMTGSIAGSGNIMSLIDNGACQTLTIPSSYCYCNMFYNCSSLTSAPELPTTIIASSCYSYMFYNCTSLTSAPELPATTLDSFCYSYMFYNCTSLTSAPELPATTLATGCYRSMFLNCTNLTSTPALPATTLDVGCYWGMFHSCSSLTSAPELPATTLASSCYYLMFYGCSRLTIAPELPATTLTTSCYRNMFSGCSSLSYIKCLATIGINENNSTTSWVLSVASSGTFIKDPNATWPTDTIGIPTGWNYINLSDKQTYENGYIYDSSVNSIAEGVINGSINNTIIEQSYATGINSHAEGINSQSIGIASHAEGAHTKTLNAYEHAQGQYNLSHDNTIHSIGIGSDSTRMNAVEVMSNGDVYIYGLNNYNGTNPTSTNRLLDILNMEFLTDLEIEQEIFGFMPPDLPYYIDALYIDDFPEDMIEDILADGGYESLEEYLEDAINDKLTAGHLGTNFVVPTLLTMEYDGIEYNLWKFFVGYNDSISEVDNLYGLMPANITYEELYQNSMEANINNRYCPFVAIGSPNDGIQYTKDDDLDNSYTLMHVHIIDKCRRPIDESHSSTFNSLFIDNFEDYGIFNSLYAYNVDTIEDYIDAVIDTEGDEYYLDSGNIFEYEGEEYRIFIDRENWGGLVPVGLTYQDLYPDSLEANSDNIKRYTSPFIATFDYNNNEVHYEGIQAKQKHSTLIAVR